MNDTMNQLKSETTASTTKSKIPNGVWLKFLKVGTISSNLIVMLALPASGAGTATLAWNPSASASVAGYNIYYGGRSGTYTNKLSVGNATSVTLTTLNAGQTYYFATTSYNASGIESMFSNEAVYSVPVASSGNAVPQNLPVLGTPSFSNGRFSIPVSGSPHSQFVVEASSNLITWVPVFTNAVPFTFVDSNTRQFVKRFFRVGSLP